jgi:uncharacterized membrane protein
VDCLLPDYLGLSDFSVFCLFSIAYYCINKLPEMKPLIVLLVVFGLCIAATWLIDGAIHYGLSGRIAMSVMLLFTAIGHFKFPVGMSMMIPSPIPYKKQLVFLTGLFEIAAAIALMIPTLQIITSWALIVFFLLVVPANINASIKHVHYQKGNYEGPGGAYLWFRVPLQILFIAWVFFFGVIAI